MEAFEAGVLHRDVSEGNIMMSRDPNVPYKGFVQDFDYALNWRKLLAKLGLGDKREDWEKFTEDECAKLIQQKITLAREELLREFEADEDAEEGTDMQEGQEVAATDLDELDTDAGPHEQETEHPQNALQSLGTEEHPSDAERVSEEEVVPGVEVPVAGPASSNPPSEEELKFQCKLRTVRENP